MVMEYHKTKRKRERQFGDVFDGLDIIGTDVHLLQFVAIEWHVVIDVLHNLMKPLSLQVAHLVATHALFVGVPNHNGINRLNISCFYGSPQISSCVPQAVRTDDPG